MSFENCRIENPYYLIVVQLVSITYGLFNLNRSFTQSQLLKCVLCIVYSAFLFVLYCNMTFTTESNIKECTLLGNHFTAFIQLHVINEDLLFSTTYLNETVKIVELSNDVHANYHVNKINRQFIVLNRQFMIERGKELWKDIQIFPEMGSTAIPVLLKYCRYTYLLYRDAL